MALSSAYLLLAVLLFVLALWLKSRKHKSLPPGPPADPLIGHLRVIPSRDQGRVFHSWAKQYGDVIQLRLPGKSIVVLDSVQAANDLLDKGGANFSCRPGFALYELMGWVPDLVILPYGPQSIKHRKILQRYVGRREALLDSQDIQYREACVLLQSLLARPDSYDECLRRFATAIIMKISYGHDIVSDDDYYLRLTGDLGYILSSSGPPGNTPIDWFPFLQHFPSWFPGTYYADFARKWRSTVRKLYDPPVEDMQKKLANGTAPTCLISSELQELGDNPKAEDIDDIKGVSAIMYAAGVDTAWSALGVFVVAMILHPECQRKAQEEIDAVIGSDRLPQFSDRERLPYVEAVVQETLRWYPVAPLGVPHRSVKEEVYRDMVIPKDSIVFANIIGMSRDENVYSDPEKFNPERFVAKPGFTPEPLFTSAFGFGRRVCPGRFLAENSLYIAIATFLSMFSVSKAIGVDGKEIEPKIEVNAGIVDHLKQVPCIIRPRSEKHRSLIEHCV